MAAAASLSMAALSRGGRQSKETAARGFAAPTAKTSEEAALDRRNLYAKRFDIVGKAWNGSLRHLRMRQSLGHAFRIPALYSSAYAGMSCVVGRSHFLSAMVYAFQPDEAVIGMPELGKLYKRLFRTFDAEGTGQVDFREVLSVLSFFQEPWDVKPDNMVLRWARHYDGHLGPGLSRPDVMRVLLTLAVTPEEASELLSLVDPGVMQSALLATTKGPKTPSTPHTADEEVASTKHQGPEIDMYAGIPIGFHGADGRPEECRPQEADGGASNMLEALKRTHAAAGGLAAGGVPHLRSSTITDGPFDGEMLPPIGGQRRSSELASKTTAVTVVLPSSSALHRARHEARLEATASKEAKGMDEMSFMSEIRRRRQRLERERKESGTAHFSIAALRIVLSRSPQLLRAIHKLRIVRAPAVVRARMIRERMTRELKQVEATFAQVSAQINTNSALKFWSQQTSRRWFDVWISFAQDQKLRRLKIWRHRSRTCLRRWYVWLCQRRVHRQRNRVAAISGYMVLQRRGFRRLKRWLGTIKELREIQMERAAQAHRLRVLERSMEDWQYIVRSDKMMARYANKTCSAVFLGWKRVTAIIKNENQMLAAAQTITGIEAGSVGEIEKIQRAIMLADAEDEARAAQHAMEVQNFMQEADFMTQIEQTMASETAGAKAAAKVTAADNQRLLDKQRAMARHEAWKTRLQAEEAASIKAARTGMCSLAEHRLQAIVASVKDWGERADAVAVDEELLGVHDESTRTLYETLAEPIVDAVSAGQTGDPIAAFETLDAASALRQDVGLDEQEAVAAAMSALIAAQTAKSLRQAGSEWAVQVDASGAPVGFVHASSSDSVELAQASSLEILDVAVSHLNGACGELAARRERRRQAQVTRTKAQQRVAAMLGRRFRAAKVREALLVPLREAIEQLVDPYTGQVHYLNNRTRAPLQQKPAMFGAKLIRQLPDWVLRIDPASGTQFYASLVQSWRTRADAPRGSLLCFACQAQLADRRCRGEDCNGYMYCWDCWSSFHPAEDPRYCSHPIERLPFKRHDCTRCLRRASITSGAASTSATAINKARFIVWSQPYDLVCTACRPSVPEGVELITF
jgi:hypothetical protein